LLANAIPPAPFPSVLTPASQHEGTDFLNLLIPANPFSAIGQNYVPAVVVFAIVYGVVIQKIQHKSALLEVLEAVQAASVTIWGWIVRFAPIGVFALFAAAAGTIQPDRLGGLLLYVGLFLLGTLLLAFVVLSALVLALVTTLSVVALPFVQKAAERVATQAGCPEGEERNDIILASLSLSYVLAQLGNYFVYLLMLYAAFVHQVRLTIGEQFAAAVPDAAVRPRLTELARRALGAHRFHRRVERPHGHRHVAGMGAMQASLAPITASCRVKPPIAAQPLPGKRLLHR
jgi:Na+/H+-dicarboxylate symporter